MPRTTSVLILTEDYIDRLDNLYGAAMEAAEDRKARDDGNAAPLLGGEVDPYDALREEYEQAKAEAEAAGVRVTLRGLDDDEWWDFIEAHPPREDERFKEYDEGLGYNTRTGLRDLILACLVEPSFANRAEFDAWVKDKGLTRGDLELLASKAYQATNGYAIDPKSLPVSPTQHSDAR